MTEHWHETIDCQHLDFEAEPQRGCTIGRIAPMDCPMCAAYKPREFIFAHIIEEREDDD
jgi:hypothetical protein